MATELSCKDIEKHIKAMIKPSWENCENNQEAKSRGNAKPKKKKNEEKNVAQPKSEQKSKKQRHRSKSDSKCDGKAKGNYEVVNGHLLGREIIDLKNDPTTSKNLSTMAQNDAGLITLDPAVISVTESIRKDTSVHQKKAERKEDGGKEKPIQVGKRFQDQRRRHSKSDSEQTAGLKHEKARPNRNRNSQNFSNCDNFSKQEDRRGQNQFRNEREILERFEVTRDKNGEIVGMVEKGFARQLKPEYITILSKQSDRFPYAVYFCQLCSFHCDDENLSRHIANDRHRNMRQFCDTEQLLNNLPYPFESQSKVVSDTIDDLCAKEGLTMSDKTARLEIVDYLNTIVKEKTLDMVCKFQVYGSSINGFGLKNSDVNIDMIVTSVEELSKGLKIVQEILMNEERFTDVVSDFEAKMPKICFKDNSSALNCNISWNNTASLQTARLLVKYSNLDERVRKLGIAVRHWAKLCLMDQQTKGTLPSHCFPILMIYFLQQTSPPVIPVLSEIGSENPDNPKAVEEKQKMENWKSKNVQSIGELWIEFLRFYSVEFITNQYVVCIRRLAPLKRGEKKWDGKILAIEDPISFKRNLSRTIPNQHVYHYILERFFDAYHYFGIPQLKRGPLFSQIPREFLNKIRKPKRKPRTANLDKKKVDDSPAGDDVLASEDNTKFPLFAHSSSSEDEYMEDQDPELSFDEVADTLINLDLGDKLRTESESSEVLIVSVDVNKEDEDDDAGSEHEVADESVKDRPLTPAELYVQNLKGSFAEEDLFYEFSEIRLRRGKIPPVYCRSCQKEGHLSEDCPSQILPALIDLPKMTEEFQKALDRACEQVLTVYYPKACEQEERKQILVELEKFVQQLFPDAKLELFGSSCNGFGFVRSDMDICLTFESNKTGEGLDFGVIIDKLADHLLVHRCLVNILPIKTAKVPIVKFTHRPTQIECDISLYNTLAQHNTRMLNMYCKIDIRVQKLGYTMKYFAKLCDIGDASRGSLSSYAYILMVLHFLQQRSPPVIPVLQELYEKGSKKPELTVDGWNAWFYEDLDNLEQAWPEMGTNHESIGTLWLGLLRYYTEEFNLKERVINVRQLAPLSRFEKVWNSRSIAIEDPFDLSHNLGVGVSANMNVYIMKALIRGREIFGTPVMFLKEPMDFFFDQNHMRLDRPPNDHGCRICRKIGHKMRDCPNSRAGKRRNNRNDTEQFKRMDRAANGVQDRVREQFKGPKERPNMGGQQGRPHCGLPRNAQDSLRSNLDLPNAVRAIANALNSNNPSHYPKKPDNNSKNRNDSKRKGRNQQVRGNDVQYQTHPLTGAPISVQRFPEKSDHDQMKSKASMQDKLSSSPNNSSLEHASHLLTQMPLGFYGAKGGSPLQTSRQQYPPQPNLGSSPTDPYKGTYLYQRPLMPPPPQAQLLPLPPRNMQHRQQQTQGPHLLQQAAKHLPPSPSQLQKSPQSNRFPQHLMSSPQQHPQNLYQHPSVPPGFNQSMALRMPGPATNLQDQQRLIQAFEDSQRYQCRPPMPLPFSQQIRTDRQGVADNIQQHRDSRGNKDCDDKNSIN